ncbi:hypothetical protein GFB49_12820 [Epibacterium sp. SM1979]|uniref:Uncharacterized protein n=1 Tax=Tritonibacter litoralis TaxID=2662264 RepID=A0A843YJB0_9RHOB|nr:hypothetical protein [Tritonibacter litoralis]MQQ09342.1 hypothetical protein [Tritonibacter litoralis]
MADELPNIDLALGAGSEYMVVVDDAQKASDLGQLLALAPGLLDPEAALVLAQAVNHIAQGHGFSVIEDPAEFASAYQAQLAKEDPSEPWQEGVIRLVDFGVPDFEEIAAPILTGETLVFFARDGFTGLPYRVEVALNPATSVGADDYKALDLEPLGDDEDPFAEEELSDEDKAFLDSLETTTDPD